MTIYELRTTEEFNATLALDSWQRDTQSGAGRLALASASLKFPKLPTLCVLDLLNGRILLHTTELGVGFEWDAPLAPAEEYRYDWKPLFFRMSEPKLTWFETMLNLNTEMQIPTRRMPQVNRPDPRLDVPVEKYAEAAQVQFYIVNGRLVRDIPATDPVFAEGGDAWNMDNVTHHRDVVREQAKE